MAFLHLINNPDNDDACKRLLKMLVDVGRDILIEFSMSQSTSFWRIFPCCQEAGLTEPHHCSQIYKFEVEMKNIMCENFNHDTSLVVERVLRLPYFEAVYANPNPIENAVKISDLGYFR
ncbi:hypothetical protein ATZ36_17870 [Candidatus Endomicrobiellum trichonymphae]|uniref:Uncharacterized protein n=1 Tax=Endomicrobium trichonymphae TaxID=1408204 RepID=A0A1E5IK75_ENDTX|nr:hypothetical protein ATZ36_17870 [Candidatus Endomicrobium trichonymphae]